LKAQKFSWYVTVKKNHPVLAKEKLVALDELWSQHEVHWMLATAWWCSAFCHPYVP
jgi:hypothetical protein